MTDDIWYHAVYFKFIPYIDEISNPQVKAIALEGLNKLPDHFWTQPSSSTGKYHPADEHGKGGLALHTLRVMKIAEILINSQIEPIYTDSVRVAAMFHDAGRYGFDERPTDHSLDNHAETGEEFLRSIIRESFKPPYPTHINGVILEVACDAIGAHMGRWGIDKPTLPEDWIVHYADIIAAQYIP